MVEGFEIGVKKGTASAVGQVASTMTDLSSVALAAVQGVDLADAGRSVAASYVGGIKDGAGKVQSALNGLAPDAATLATSAALTMSGPDETAVANERLAAAQANADALMAQLAGLGLTITDDGRNGLATLVQRQANALGRR